MSGIERNPDETSGPSRNSESKAPAEAGRTHNQARACCPSTGFPCDRSQVPPESKDGDSRRNIERRAGEYLNSGISSGESPLRDLRSPAEPSSGNDQLTLRDKPKSGSPGRGPRHRDVKVISRDVRSTANSTVRPLLTSVRTPEGKLPGLMGENAREIMPNCFAESSRDVFQTWNWHSKPDFPFPSPQGALGAH